MPGISLTDNSEYLNTLVSSGADAMTNLYYIKFTGCVDKASSIVQSLMVRAGDFQAPTISQGNHTVNFLSVDALMPTAQINIDKQFSLTFRVDEHYKVYKYLLAAQANTSLASTGIALNDVSEDPKYSLGMEVYAPTSASSQYNNSTGEPKDWKKIYSFDHLWIRKLDPPKFSYDNGGAMTVTATFGFFGMKQEL